MLQETNAVKEDIRAAHRPNEHVAIDDLVACAAALATTIVRWCGATS